MIRLDTRNKLRYFKLTAGYIIKSTHESKDIIANIIAEIMNNKYTREKELRQNGKT